MGSAGSTRGYFAIVSLLRLNLTLRFSMRKIVPLKKNLIVQGV